MRVMSLSRIKESSQLYLGQPCWIGVSDMRVVLVNSAGVLQWRGIRMTTDGEPGMGIGVDMGEGLCDIQLVPLQGYCARC